MGASLLESGSPQDLVKDLCRQVMVFLDCDAFFNFLVDHRSARLHLNACAGISAEDARRIEWLDYGAAVCGCDARDRSRIIAENIQNTCAPCTGLVKSLGIQAYCCHPLMVQGRLIGTLSFGTRSRPKFTLEEIDVMEAVTGLVAIATNRIEMDRALRESEDGLKKTQEISHLGSWQLDLVRDRLTWSDEVYRIFGVEPQAFGATYEAFLDAVHPEDRAAVDAAYSSSLQENRDTYEIEHRVVRKGTGASPLRSRALPTRTRDSRPPHHPFRWAWFTISPNASGLKRRCAGREVWSCPNETLRQFALRVEPRPPGTTRSGRLQPAFEPALLSQPMRSPEVFALW
jgi:PAS domain-containing protein